MTRSYAPLPRDPSPLTMGDDDGRSPGGFRFLAGWLAFSAACGVVLGGVLVAGWPW